MPLGPLTFLPASHLSGRGRQARPQSLIAIKEFPRSLISFLLPCIDPSSLPPSCFYITEQANKKGNTATPVPIAPNKAPAMATFNPLLVILAIF